MTSRDLSYPYLR